jgi:AraC-like DNA-binding protein
MLKNLDYRPDCGAPRVGLDEHEPDVRAALALGLRRQLGRFADALAQGRCRLHRPAPMGVTRGAGHFHLAPELFLQIGGWTRFSLPQGETLLGPGEALLLPAQLLHHETIGPGAHGTPFSNLVVYADARVLSCHLAHEHEPGLPGILYLESRQHAQAGRVLGWLGDASGSVAAPAQVPDAAGGVDVDVDIDIPALLARSLVAASLAGLRQAIDAPATATSPAEPSLIARLRVLVNNQLGDQALSVRELAGQCGCSADHLSHRFRLATGEHLVAYINRLRLERAAHLLADTGLAIKEIAWACGYASASYFIRSFRQQHGATPLAWRAARALAA